MNNPKIELSKVKKDFFLQGDRTFKELIPSLLLGKNWAKKLNALSNISMNIGQGETVGIIGDNGAGKSTLMKLIAGVTYPTKGNIEVAGRVAPLIELGAGFHHELTGYENIFLNSAILGMHKAEIEEVSGKIVDFSGLDKKFLNTPIKRYSTGMVMRLAFSIAIHARASIFLIDEVLAVGDIEFQAKCINRLEEIKRKGDSIILFVSHDLVTVSKFCERVLLIEKGNVVMDNKAKIVISKYKKG